MFDHVGILVSDFTKSVQLYTKALEPLGYVLASFDEKSRSAGFGKPDAPALWLNHVEKKKTSGMHLAFPAADRDAVRRFYEAALACGAKDNGAPGVREAYGPSYFAAFVLDLDGNNLEAVCLR